MFVVWLIVTFPHFSYLSREQKAAFGEKKILVEYAILIKNPTVWWDCCFLASQRKEDIGL